MPSCRSGPSHSRPKPRPESSDHAGAGEALRTLKDVVERNARYHGDSLFQVFGERRQTFREYAGRARRLASALHAGGLKPQDRVGLLGMNCAEYLEIYGVSEVAPFVMAPVNFRLAPPEIGYILRDSAPTVLFFEKQYEATIDALRTQLPTVKRFICFGGPAPAWAEDYEAVRRERFARRARARGPSRTPACHRLHQRHDGSPERRDDHARGVPGAGLRLGARTVGRCGRPHPALHAVLPRRRPLAGVCADLCRRHDAHPARVRSSGHPRDDRAREDHATAPGADPGAAGARSPGPGEIRSLFAEDAQLRCGAHAVHGVAPGPAPASVAS